MGSLERIRLITKQYCSLQGLRLTPLWLFMALKPCAGVLPNHRPTFVRDYSTIAAFLFCLFWIWYSGKYYSRRYGRVESQPTRWWVWLSIVMFMAVYFACMFADDKNPPVSFVALLWASLLATLALGITGIPVRRVYYGIGAVSVAILAFAPSTGRITATQLLSSNHPSGLVLIGLVMTTLAVLDHFQLVRMFEHPLENANV
jgi:MFS family permease